MVFEKEVTVEINLSLEKIKEYFESLNFKLKEEYSINDIYMVKKDFIDSTNNYLEILKNCVLIRDIIEKDKEIKMITYKYKEYNENGDIVKQGKSDCRIYDVANAKELLESIGYIELIKINDNIMVFSNDYDEFALQDVNNRHIYLEIEEKCNYIVYSGIDEMKEVIKKYDIPVKSENYFVKKAEIELMEKYGNKE